MNVLREFWDRNVLIWLSGFLIPLMVLFIVLGCSTEKTEIDRENFKPKLGYEEIGKQALVTIKVPALPGKINIWCYEGGVGNPVRYESDGEVLILTHRRGDAVVMSRFEPVDDGVELNVEVRGPNAESVKSVRSLNPCWQFQRSDAFRWQGRDDGREDYVDDFVARCFVILDRGLTLMKDTRRVSGTRPGRPRVNQPNPWIQEYIPIWREHPGQIEGRRGNSLDRPVYPIIGCVSRDGKYLAAFAWPETGSLGQVWHDCLHPRPRVVESYDAQTNRIVSRARLYFMYNDEAALIAAFKRDFPDWRMPIMNK